MVLTVGDYILSDQICIERKSVATGDLFESFKSGRLLQQVSNMNQFYKRPCLLIEFEPEIPFKLQDAVQNQAVGVEISAQSVISKISLLTLHFPNLQIIWSKNPAHTAQILLDLKESLDEAQRDPDLMKIEKIGKVSIGAPKVDASLDPEEAGDDETSQGNGDFSKLLPREFLKRIPGVNSTNMPMIMHNCKNMVELVDMTDERLKELVGQRSQKLISAFLKTKVDQFD
jgi:DNA excision repair protein ERCC-4